MNSLCCSMYQEGQSSYEIQYWLLRPTLIQQSHLQQGLSAKLEIANHPLLKATMPIHKLKSTSANHASWPPRARVSNLHNSPIGDFTVGQRNYFTTNVTVLYELPLVAVLSTTGNNNVICSMSNQDVAVSCGFDTWFAVRLVMDYTTSHFAWSILGYLTDPAWSGQP